MSKHISWRVVVTSLSMLFMYSRVASYRHLPYENSNIRAAPPHKNTKWKARAIKLAVSFSERKPGVTLNSDATWVAACLSESIFHITDPPTSSSGAQSKKQLGCVCWEGLCRYQTWQEYRCPTLYINSTRYKKNQPITMFWRSKAWTLFVRSDAWIAGSYPTQDTDVCMFILCLCCPVCR
jgi:hypothetical protein